MDFHDFDSKMELKATQDRPQGGSKTVSKELFDYVEFCIPFWLFWTLWAAFRTSESISRACRCACMPCRCACMRM